MTEPDLFPLPFSPIETLWMLEDCPSHPMTFFLRVGVSGTLQRKPFEQAVQNTLERHPLFTALIEHIDKARWQWVKGPVEPLEVIWQTGDLTLIPEAKPLDLYKERGLRITVTEVGQRSTITLQVQHTVCDGLSASDFAGDLMTYYVQACRPEEKYKFKRINPARIHDRGDSGLSAKERRGWLIKGARSITTFRQFYKRKPIRVIDKNHPREDNAMSVQPKSIFRRFSREESVAVNKYAKGLGTNLNGLLIARCFTSFLQWRNKHTAKPAKDHSLFRITMALSLKESCHRAVSAANIVSLVCFDRSVSEINDLPKLIEWLNQEIVRTKAERRGLILPFMINLVSKPFPVQLKEGIRRKRFSGSVLITNLGPVLTNCHLSKEAGKIVLDDQTQVESVEFLSVLRPGHVATLAATTYAGQLAVGMHFDSRLITDEQAAELFGSYTDALQEG